MRATSNYDFEECDLTDVTRRSGSVRKSRFLKCSFEGFSIKGSVLGGATGLAEGLESETTTNVGGGKGSDAFICANRYISWSCALLLVGHDLDTRSKTPTSLLLRGKL